MTIPTVKFVLLDTSHLGGLCADATARELGRRGKAEEFLDAMYQSGRVPVFCFHHLEELIQHGNENVVDGRLAYLSTLPHVAYVRPSDGRQSPGTIVDVFATEAEVAFEHPKADLFEVRELARSRVFQFGSGKELIPEAFRDWRVFRTVLDDHQDNARRVAAISRWRATPIERKRIGSLLGYRLRSPAESNRVLCHLRDQLAAEISSRGDPRIDDPDRMASDFLFDVARGGSAFSSGEGGLPPVIQLLQQAGLEPEEIDLSATFGETMDRLIFKQRLQQAAEARALPWEGLKRAVPAHRLPCNVIAEAMRAHSQDLHRREGGELNDTHFLGLAPYTKVTYVDKRTLENTGRASKKVPQFAKLVGDVRRASDYTRIARAFVNP